MNKNLEMLEFYVILDRLAGKALTARGKARALNLTPFLKQAEAKSSLDETTDAKALLNLLGSPPLSAMTGLSDAITVVAQDGLLSPDQLELVAAFAASCQRLAAHLKKGEETGNNLAFYGRSFHDLTDVSGEIDRSIRNGAVDDRASDKLAGLRRKIAVSQDQIKKKLEDMLRHGKYYSENFVAMRGGRYTLPVKKEFKNSVPGTVLDMSQSGSTVFIEPAAVTKLQAALSALEMEADSEARRILYALTALVHDNMEAIRLNMETMEALDFVFAKGKLSADMRANPASVSLERRVHIVNGVHPLLNPQTAVPLHFQAGGNVTGVVVTGPNTGGKTVAIKTVGLLTAMAQSGLHVTADDGSVFPLCDHLLCDIGDGQNISENLSTFSAHMTSIIRILKQATAESLVLLDELGSGTDPAEGMGLAVAVLEELCDRGCLFLATTHYPEIKAYAHEKPGLINARMAFDKDSLKPLYTLTLGEAGESCALAIARRLGLSEKLLSIAEQAAYGDFKPRAPVPIGEGPAPKPKPSETATNSPGAKFKRGDSVMVYPGRETGIVYAVADERGMVGVMVRKTKKSFNHKRLKLLVPASELYPEDYDFAILFDSVQVRKARALMQKRHVDGNVIELE